MKQPTGLERTTEQRDLTDLSASRINLAQKCGLAFKYNYVDHLPQPTESAKAIFGTVIHRAVETWYGGPGPITEANQSVHKDLTLPDLVAAEWANERVPPVVWQYVRELADLDQECQSVCAMITLRRPTIKAPSQTKEFLASQPWLDFNAKKTEMMEKIADFQEIRWPKDEDPFKAYQRSMEMAERMEREWKPLPRPVLIEEPFRLEFEGFVLRGAIDQVRWDPNLTTGALQVPRILDIKTGAQLMTQMEAFVQAWTYHVACRGIELPFDSLDDFSFHFTRHVDAQGRTKAQQGSIVPDRHDKIALRILNGVGRKIITGQHEPHYGHWCKMCDYKDICEQELRIWDGDGVLLTI